MPMGVAMETETVAMAVDPEMLVVILIPLLPPQLCVRSLRLMQVELLDRLYTVKMVPDTPSED